MYESEEEDEILYEVEKILGVRYNKEKNKVQFLIKWKNYDSRCDNTWEQEENLECPMLLKQFWDTLNIGPDRKKWMYEGKEKKMMIPSIESQDVIYLDDDDDDDFTDDLFYPPQPKATQPVSVLQPKPDNHHVSRTREEKRKQRYQPPQQQQIRQLPQNQKMMDRQQKQYSPSQKKSYSQEKRSRSSSAIPISSSSITPSLMTSSSSSISIPTSNTCNMSPRARLEAEVNARIGKKKSEAPMQRRPIKSINIVSYKNRMLSESRASSSPPIQTPIRKRPHHTDDYLNIKASKTEKKQSPTSFADIDTLFNKIQDNKKDRHISRYD